LHDGSDPCLANVAQQQRTQRAVVVRAAEPAVDLSRREDEAPSLAEIDNLVHFGRRHARKATSDGDAPANEFCDVQGFATRRGGTMSKRRPIRQQATVAAAFALMIAAGCTDDGSSSATTASAATSIAASTTSDSATTTEA